MAGKRHHHSMKGAYEGHEGRRHQEMKDAGMIHEDKSQVANMPQMVKYHAWPSPSNYGVGDGSFGDDIASVNRQMSMDDNKAASIRNPHKY